MCILCRTFDVAFSLHLVVQQVIFAHFLTSLLCCNDVSSAIRTEFVMKKFAMMNILFSLAKIKSSWNKVTHEWLRHVNANILSTVFFFIFTLLNLQPSLL